ncbi:aado keto reductase [Moniliophthora roreri MCA 2997]|uniref:Aado keto reductase n=1 Tax=Moniliophthora roreri (strain MCA 2997) TaxID=1381753 RepID=V2XJZ5_MONRO|nr:aado keto reductase [Moniliophthora roreri MCA 2997]
MLEFKLNNGVRMPAVGIGCWMGQAGNSEQVVDMVKMALRIGYRHIDTALNYGNELSVGKAIRDSGVQRNEIFLTTKLSSEDHGRVAEALERSLENLGVEYVDLYLMHWPQAFSEKGTTLSPEESPTLVETWKMMEKLLDSGKVKSIGVSNFSIQTLSTLLAHAQIIPATNQVEMHPCLPQHSLLEFCRKHDILLTAYSPVGKHKFASDPDISAIAERMGVSVAQTLLSWGVQRGTAVIPKTVQEERLKENIQLLSLSTSDMEILNNLYRKPGMHRSICGFHSPELGGSCFGWTYDMLGWDMNIGGIMCSAESF